MRDILDPAHRWVGTPLGAIVAGNKRPVAIDDAIVVAMDSDPVVVNVLVNDFDPEGQPLTLVSAIASLGQAIAEADNTISYMPPSGIDGFDTVVYEIADDLDQRQFGQVNITISSQPLSISILADNTMEVSAANGPLDLTVSSPANFAAAWQFSTSDLSTGPLNLSPPAITGTVATGQTLTAMGGLWVYDIAAGNPTRGFQWQRNGSDISGATGASYVAQAADVGADVRVVETQSDNFGQRFAASTTVGGSFSPSDDSQLIEWWDADDDTTIEETSGAVSGWGSKASTMSLVQSNAVDQPETGTRLLNGRNILDFSGTNYLTAPITLPSDGNVSFHMALVIDSTANAFEAVLSVDSNNDFQIDANNASQFDGRLNAAGIGSSVNFSGGPFSGALILSVVFDRTGAGIANTYISDQLRGSMGYTAPLDTSTVLHLMTNRSRNAWVNGAVAEVIVTGSTSNRSQYHAYLAAKWGLV